MSKSQYKSVAERIQDPGFCFFPTVSSHQVIHEVKVYSLLLLARKNTSMTSRNDSGISVSFFLDQDLIVFKLNRIASLQFVHAILAFMRLIVRPKGNGSWRKKV
jgi:hypothetical protein